MSELSERVQELEYDLKHTKEVLTSAQRMLVAVRQDKRALTELLDEARLDVKQIKAANQEHSKQASEDYLTQTGSITKLQNDVRFYKAAMEKAQQRSLDALTKLQQANTELQQTNFELGAHNSDLRAHVARLEETWTSSQYNDQLRKLTREKNERGNEINRLQELAEQRGVDIRALNSIISDLRAEKDSNGPLHAKIIELRHEISRLQSTFVTREDGVTELTVPGQLARVAKALEESNRIREEELT